jgi:hypothetical protein
VSHLGVLGRKRAADALSERAERLAGLIGEDQRHLDEALAGGDLPRLFVIEAEYLLAMARAERDWVLMVIEEIGSARLAWPSLWQQHGKAQR